MIRSLVFIAMLFVACGCALTSFAGATTGDDAPPVFDKRAYAEAKKAAADGKKWFIVKATAEWCGPCKQMDKTTWRDEKVVKWITDNAIVIALDVDKEPKRSQELSVEAMPTMIAFKNGVDEFDRIVGYKPADEMLVWLEGLAKGEKSIEAVRRKATTPAAGEKQDVAARMDLARTLSMQGKGAEAADEYVWLWDNMLAHAPSYYGVRLSFMVGDMERLASANKDAKAKFTVLRDKLTKSIDAERVATDQLVDWVCLNKVIGDTAATMAWYDKVKDQARMRPLMAHIERDLIPLLVEKKRWADVGKMYSRPLEAVEQKIAFNKMMLGDRFPGGDEQIRKEQRQFSIRNFQEEVKVVYAGLLAAGKDADATKVADLARTHDKSPDMVSELVSAALEANQPRDEQKAWLDSAIAMTKADAKQASKVAELEEIKAKVVAGLKK